VIVSIHQPLYLPWQPYFAKIANSDAFIFLDDVQYPGGRSFFNRNIIKGPNGKILLTAPVVGRSELPLIKNLKLDITKNLQFNHWKTISLSYKKSKYFELYQKPLEEIYLGQSYSSLASFSVDLVCCISALLKLKTKFYRSSELMSSSSSGAGRLIDLVKQVNGSRYLTGSGAGSMRYMDISEYEHEGILVYWHEYFQEPYKQLWGEFMPDTFILDLLFNCGPNASEYLMRNSTMRTEKKGGAIDIA
jgi:hypothetical protein